MVQPNHEDNRVFQTGVHETMSTRQARNATVTVLKSRWSEKQVLTEARRRTKELFHPKAVQEMLASLIKEAGWNEEEFIDALCQDVIKRGGRR